MRYMAGLIGAGHFLMLRFWLQGSTRVMPEEKDVQFQSSSMAEAACSLGLWDCGCISHRSTDHFTVAGASFAGCSRVTVSLRRHIERMVRWSRPGIARYSLVRFRFLLLLPASDLFFCCKARGDTTPSSLHGVSPVRRVAERCAKERHGIASARAR